jgi:hypothetical protein
MVLHSLNFRLGRNKSTVISYLMLPRRGTGRCSILLALRTTGFLTTFSSSLASCRNSQRGTTKYGLLSGELHSLTNLRNTLNHTHRRINIMKIDCEGCEWDAFWEMSRFDTHALDDVEMLLIEVHPVRERMLRTDADLRKFVAVWEYLLEQQGFRFFFHRPNAGARHPTWTLHEHMSATGALRKVCCFELGLVKPHSVKRHLAYFNRDGLHQSLYHDLLRESYPWPSGRRPITAG